MRHIPFNRTLCASAALLCFAAAFVLTPGTARSQLAAVPDVVPVTRPAIVIPPIFAVAPQRDAFVPRAPVEDDEPASGVRPSVLPAVPRGLAPRGQVPAADGPHVTAIAIGAQSSAIVDTAGATRVITVGDRIAHARVTAIDRTGIDLENGKRLSLTGEAVAP